MPGSGCDLAGSIARFRAICLLRLVEEHKLLSPKGLAVNARFKRSLIDHRTIPADIGARTKPGSLMQAQKEIVDMVPDNPGIWMFHCHLDDHMDAGMVALYKVEP